MADTRKTLLAHEPTASETSRLSARPWKEHPILFRGEMVRAILDGRKMQTRRIVKPQPFIDHLGDHSMFVCGYVWLNKGRVLADWKNNVQKPESMVQYSPYGVPGDHLWVRESHLAWTGGAGGTSDVMYADDPEWDASLFDKAVIDADRKQGRIPNSIGNWKKVPSIHMPRWACRLVLEITDVRVDRLQEISEDDAKAEGVAPFPNDPEGDYWTDGKHRTAFEHLWMQIHGGPSWMENPWLWVISFKRVDPKTNTDGSGSRRDAMAEAAPPEGLIGHEQNDSVDKGRVDSSTQKGKDSK